MQLPSARVRSLFALGKKNPNLLNYCCLPILNKLVFQNRCANYFQTSVCDCLSCWSCVLCWCWQRAHGMCVNCGPYSMNMHLHLSWPQWCFPSSDPRLPSLSVSHPWTVRVKGLFTKMKWIVAQKKKKKFSVAATSIHIHFLIILSCQNKPVMHSCCGEQIWSQVFPHKE